MDKIIIRGIIIFVPFFALWFLLQQIDLKGFIDPELVTKSKFIERKLGEMMIDEFTRKDDLVEDDFVVKTIDSLVARVCEPNHIDKEKLKVYVIDNEQVNAFALPDKQLVIYTGLIRTTKNAEALSGVIAHELAHIENDHVMKSLIREIGIGVLFALISGNSDISILTEIAQMLSSTAFSRDMEKEADLAGVEYLQNAKIDPLPFAEFIGVTTDVEFSALKWISTHPMSKERKDYIFQHINKKDADFQEIIKQETWDKLQNQFSL